MRWGPGPVFIYECLVTSRRRQTYALRSAGVGVLLLSMGMVAASGATSKGTSARDYADLGQAYFFAMIFVELALVMLAAPAATAGAICLDRARGTLAHMLMTDLSDPEIVLGKLFARLLPVLGLVACSWPVMAISSLLGGIDPIALTLAFAILVAVSVLGCSIAVAISVWARKSHEVILATYTVFIIGLLCWPIWEMLSVAGTASSPPAWALLANPFYVAFAPYADPGKLGPWDYFAFFGVALGAAGLLTGLAVWRMRPVACRDRVAKKPGTRFGWMRRVGRWLPGPSLDRNPVLWREWHRSRPSRGMTAIVVLLMGTTGTICVIGAVAIWVNKANSGPGMFWGSAAYVAYFLHMVFGLLMLAAIAPTSMAEERQRGSLDVLLATALSTREIVVGKWLGTFRLVLPMAVGPGLLALAVATARSGVPGTSSTGYRVVSLAARIYGVVIVIANILAHGALITSIGLALSVWIKRQGRAIAMSVAAFLLVTAIWPIFVPSGWFLECFSLLVLGNLAIVYVATGQHWSNSLVGVPAIGTFWPAVIFGMALALLWLTIQTFHLCFDRIPDVPPRISPWTVAVKMLAGIIGAASLAASVESWIAGTAPGSLNEASSFGIMAYSLLVAIGLALVAVDSGPPKRLTRIAGSDQALRAATWRFVLGRGRAYYVPVLMLGIGPALVALALATTYRTAYEPQYTTNSAGSQVFSGYVLTNVHAPYPGEVRLAARLMMAAVLIVTILVHGAAAVSIRLGIATARGRAKHVLEVAAGLGLSAALWSFVVSENSLFKVLVTRSSLSPGKTIVSVVVRDAIVFICAVGIAWWTIRTWRRRLAAGPEVRLYVL